MIGCDIICVQIDSDMPPTISAAMSSAASAPAPANDDIDFTGLRRLNYIGSKLKLIDWLFGVMKDKTGDTLNGKKIIDAFAGTGVVSYALRQEGATVMGNDTELYSVVITHALAKSAYTEPCKTMISRLNTELTANAHLAVPPGFITQHYSPVGSDRTFFTADNARRADYVRKRLAEEQHSLSDDDHAFLLASILVSTDRIANVAAVYGCYLKQFKASAQRPLILEPVHINTTPGNHATRVLNLDATTSEFLSQTEGDIAYIDPPYNNRQYSKNYFPLAMLAKSPCDLDSEPPLKGKTGIPEACFVSKMCKKREALDSMLTLLTGIRCKWVFVSYNTEGIIQEGDMIKMMRKIGDVTIVRREYKRFKSYNYNEDKQIQELLFCLCKVTT